MNCEPAPAGDHPRGIRASQILAKKARLLLIAREQFIAQGYRAVTMESIAQMAGVSKRSLYLWHEDKAALFRACLLDGTRRFPTLSFDPATGLRDGLHGFGVALVREFIQPSTLGMGKLIVREADDFAELARQSERGYEEHLIQPLADQLRRAELAGSKAADLARLLLSMILAPVHSHLLMGSPLPDEATIDSSVAIAVDTFLLGAARATARLLSHI